MIRGLTKTIGRKLSLSFAALLVFLLVVGITGVAGNLITRSNMDNVLNHDLDINQTSFKAWVDLLEAEQHADEYFRTYLLLGDDKAKQDLADPLIQYVDDMRTQLKSLVVLDTSKGHMDDVTTEQNMLAAADEVQTSFLSITEL